MFTYNRSIHTSLELRQCLVHIDSESLGEVCAVVVFTVSWSVALHSVIRLEKINTEFSLVDASNTESWLVKTNKYLYVKLWLAEILTISQRPQRYVANLTPCLSAVAQIGSTSSWKIFHYNCLRIICVSIRELFGWVWLRNICQCHYFLCQYSSALLTTHNIK